MSKRIRVNAKFGDTKLLVPCGEGDITVEELIEKAIGRFRKHKKLHDDDQVIVDDIFQADGSACDRDDEVIDILDDKEVVTFVYKLIPHDAPPGYQPVIVGGANTSETEPLSQPQAPTSLNEIKQNGVPFHGSYQPSPIVPPPSASDYSPQTKEMYSSPVPSYNGDVGGVYGRDFLSTPTNLYNSREDILNDVVVVVPINNSVQSNNSNRPSDDFRPSGIIHNDNTNSGQLIEEDERLSQVGMEDDGGFSQDMSSSHPHSQVGHSQISLHSQESHKYSSSNTPNFEMSSGGGVGGGEGERDHDTSNFHQNTNLEISNNSSSKSTTMLDSTTKSTPNKFSFTTSQSMERLDLYQPPQGRPASQQFQDYHGFNRTGMNYTHGPALSQDYPMVHSQQDMYYYPPSEGGGGGGYMMTQPEGSMWNPRLYPAQRYRHPYPPPHMQQPHPSQRPPYPMSGRDPYDRRPPPESDYYHHHTGYSPYPPPSHPSQQYNDYNTNTNTDRRNKRTSLTGVPLEYDDHMSGGRMRFPPRGGGGGGWKGYDDDYLHPQRERDEDPDYYLSQPAPTYSASGGRYSHQFTTPPMAMGRPSNMSGPSGYSLSQPGGSSSFSFDKIKKKSVLKNRNEQSPRSDIKSKPEDPPTHGYSIDEELYEDDDFDDSKPSPFFKRSASKSMNLDNKWGKWEDILTNMNLPDEYECQVPEYEDEIDKSQGKEDTKEDKEEVNDLGNVHIVELLRGDEPLGIQLVSYTSEGRDLGVFVGVLDEDGFASKSGSLRVSDRILACNGEDFTSETNERVEDRFREMAEKEPLLRMAISRGLMLDLTASNNTAEEQPTYNNASSSVTASNTAIGESSSLHTAGAATAASTNTNTNTNTNTTNTMSNVFTNTRQIGVKHVITISRSAKGTFGFGLSSRDVATNDNDHPIYVKAISSTGPAFQDGRLKLGDRLLEVNDTSVKGLTQQEAVNLLRLSGNTVKLLISRQEIVESQDEYTESSEITPVVSSVGKNVMVFDIHLDNGLAGLGVTVHGRCSSKKNSTGDMGIYIKSIVPGGAAARDGRLQVHDQLLSVNNQSVTNMSNRDAMESLKKALNHSEPNKISSIQLTIARTSPGAASSSSNSRKHNFGFSSQMPALQEEERVAPDGEQTNEIGIDCPTDDKLSQMLSQELDLGENFDIHPVHEELMLSRSSTGSQSSVTGRLDSSLEAYTTTITSNNNRQQQSDNTTTTTLRSGPSRPDYSSSSLNRVGSSSPHISRQKDMSYSSVSLPRPNDFSYRGDNYIDRMMGNNDKTSHMTSSGVGTNWNNIDDSRRRNDTPPRRQESISPTREHSPWLTSSANHSSRQSPNFAYTRSASFNSELSSHSQPINYTAHHQSHHNLIPFSETSSYSSSSTNSTKSFQHGGSRNNSFRRKASPPYDTLAKSSAPGKDRYVNVSLANESLSSTLPRMSAGRNSGKYTVNEQDPSNEDAVSLVSYSSDSELNNINPFQRDDKTRKSIPKNQKTPQPKLDHVQLANVVPMMEGEGSPSPPLYRTGSDTDIATVLSHTRYPDMLQDVPVGPQLRLAKSSSLESLQTVMHYTINADVTGGPLRSRGSTRHSFRRAVDRSYAQEHEDSRTASASVDSKEAKKKSRRSLLTFLRKKPNSNSKDKKKGKGRRSRAMSTTDFDFSEDSIDKLAQDFGISVDTIRRMQSHSGKLDGDENKKDDSIASREEQRQDHYLYSHHNSRAL